MTNLKIGDKAPDFNAVSEDGTRIKLSNFKGKKVILFFYPKANTPGCTAEACNLRDNSIDLLEKGFEVLGVSADDEKKQMNFRTKYNLPYPLIADTEKEVITAYGVWGPKKFMGREYDGIHRTTFVIDENGMIEHIFLKVKTKDHTNQILSEYDK